MTPRDEFIVRVTHRLDAAGIPYAICGSVAAGFHGHPRATMDVDILISVSATQLDAFVDSFDDGYYVSRDAARDALRHWSMFNVIDVASGWKADLIVLKPAPFAQEEFRRRVRMDFSWGSVFVQTPEDVILSKLEWARESESERQVQDAVRVAAAGWKKLDLPYLRRWAKELSVKDSLEQVLADAERLQS